MCILIIIIMFSPELIEKLLERKTHGCGTVRKDCWGLPKAVSKAKLTKRGQTMFHRKGNLLALKWKDKRDLYILTGIHKADSIVSLKRTYKGEKIRKREAVFIYNWYMFSVDLTDQFSFIQFSQEKCQMAKEVLYPLYQHGHVECIHAVQALCKRKENSQAVLSGYCKAFTQKCQRKSKRCFRNPRTC